MSTAATSTVNEIADGAPDVLRFFQMTVFRERQVTVQLVQRAERAGFSALVVTVDQPLVGKRRDDRRNNFTLSPHLRSVKCSPTYILHRC